MSLLTSILSSITWGSQSSDENGYRNALHQLLTSRGNPVDFVGGVASGSMNDNQHEGHPGKRISEIADESTMGIAAAANIVLVHAGTNDANQNHDVANAPARLKSLVDSIFKSSPKAAIFLCQLIPARKKAVQAGVNTINAAIPGIVNGYVAAGKKVTLVEMNNALSLDDIKDNLHPNDEGYVKMANAYWAAIQAADAKGWISVPGTPTAPAPCKASPSWSGPHLIAKGPKVATSDGDFKPTWSVRRVGAGGACARSQLHFFDLDGDGLKDYACVDKDSSAVKVYINVPNADGKASGKWNEIPGYVKPGMAGFRGDVRRVSAINFVC